MILLYGSTWLTFTFCTGSRIGGVCHKRRTNHRNRIIIRRCFAAHTHTHVRLYALLMVIPNKVRVVLPSPWSVAWDLLYSRDHRTWFFNQVIHLIFRMLILTLIKQKSYKLFINEIKTLLYCCSFFKLSSKPNLNNIVVFRFCYSKNVI